MEHRRRRTRRRRDATPLRQEAPVIEHTPAEMPLAGEPPAQTPAVPVWRLREVDGFYNFFNDRVVMCTDDAEPQREPEEIEERGSRVRAIHVPSSISYDEIYDDFDDLYLASFADGKCETLSQRRSAQQARASELLSSYCKDMHFGRKLIFEKRANFLRECLRRANEATEQTKEAIPDDRGDHFFLKAKSSKAVLPADVTTPPLGPRRWPHIPFRNPREWTGNVSGVLQFIHRVRELPEGSLMYEPIDVDGFVGSLSEVLRHDGFDIWGDTIPKRMPLTTLALAALTALTVLAVRLQSFSLLALVARLFDEYDIPSTIEHRDRLLLTVESDLQKLRSSFSHSLPPRLFARNMVARWSIDSYQPLPGDAIATDGLHLYLYGRKGLLKIGTGRGATVRNYLYAHNRDYSRSRDAEMSWLCCIGSFLYCRNSMMPSSRVDRIPIGDLKIVEELYFGPVKKHHPFADAASFAMVTDGNDLITIRLVDSRKRRLGQTLASAKPLDEIPSNVSNSYRASDRRNADSSVKVGDRVIRGPDWKWGDQDGEAGQPGTVERISTWGGIKGCGITVRWDKNRRVNTYRWGAEGCYDILVVVEKDGKVVSKKPLPANASIVKERFKAQNRHHFEVTRFDVSNIRCLIELDEEDIGTFIGSPPDIREEVQRCLISSTHEHTLGASSSRTSWSCDGGTTDCLGGDSGSRFRCEAGCDFDLCEGCIVSTLVGRHVPRPLMGHPDNDESGRESCVINQDMTAHGPDSKSRNDGLLEAGGTLVECEEARVLDDLTDFWYGAFSRRECKIAIDRAGSSLQDAANWLNTCGEYLRRKVLLIPTASVVLELPRSIRGIDETVFLSSSIYAVNKQLCIVLPEGLFDKDTLLTGNDFSILFSLDTGKTISIVDKGLASTGVQAGSPICVSSYHRLAFVLSLTLNKVHEFSFANSANPETFESTSNAPSDSPSLNMFESLHISCLRKTTRVAYKLPLAGLHDLVNELEVCGGKLDQLIKHRTRQLTKLRLRLQEFKRIGMSDSIGYIVPYAADFRTFGLRSLLLGLFRAMGEFNLQCEKPRHMFCSLYYQLSVFRSVLEDLEQAEVLVTLPSCIQILAQVVGQMILDVAQGVVDEYPSDDSVMFSPALPLLCQDIIILASHLGLFRDFDRTTILADRLRDMNFVSTLPGRYFPVMFDYGDGISPLSRLECCISFTRKLLRSNSGSAFGFVASIKNHDEAIDIFKMLLTLCEQEMSARSTSQPEGLDGPHLVTVVEKATIRLFCSAMARGKDVALFTAVAIEVLNRYVICQGGKVDFLRFPFFEKLLALIAARHEVLLSPFSNTIQDAAVLVLKKIYKGFEDRLPTDPHEYAESHVVESNHPYNRVQSVFKRTIHVPGACCLHITFDPRTCTASKSDFVIVKRGRDFDYADSSTACSSALDGGGCYHGSRTEGNWPRGGVCIWGNTATVMLCSSNPSRGSSRHDTKESTWGFRAIVRGIFTLDSSASRVCGAEALSYALNIQAQRHLEKSVAQHVELSTDRSFHVLNGLKRPVNRELVKNLVDTLNGRSEDDMSVGLFQRFNHAMNDQPPRGRWDGRCDQWKTALQLVFVVAIGTRVSNSPSELESTQWSSILRDVTAIEREMIKDAQVLNELTSMSPDSISVSQLSERFSTDVVGLAKVCLMKNVPFSDGKMEESISGLSAQLLKEWTVSKSAQLNYHEQVANVIIEKARYALEKFLDSVELHEHYNQESFNILAFFTHTTSVVRLRSIEQRSHEAVGIAEASLRQLQDPSGCGSVDAVPSWFGFIGACLGAPSTSPLYLQDTHTQSNHYLSCAISNLRNSSSPLHTRLGSLIDVIFIWSLFHHHWSESCSTHIIESAIDLLFEIEKTGDKSRTYCYSVDDVAWVSFRFAVDMIIRGTESSRVGNLLVDAASHFATNTTFINDRRKFDVLARVLTLACSHVRAFGPAARDDFAVLCMTQLLDEEAFDFPSQLSSIRLLKSLLHSSTSVIRTEVHDTPCIVDCILRRIGTLASCVRRVNEEIKHDSKAELGCVVVFEDGANQSMIEKALDVLDENVTDTSALPPTLCGLSQQEENMSTSDVDSTIPSDVVHRNVRCDGCDQSPIRGYRFKCLVCTDYDLCFACYGNRDTHDWNHQFTRSSSSGSAEELLLPRSKSNGKVIPEAAVVGSKHWLSITLRELIEAHGYVVLYRGHVSECTQIVNALISARLPATGILDQEIKWIESLNDWESTVMSEIVPGSSRLRRRSSSLPVSSPPRQVDRSLMPMFNRRVADSDCGINRMQDYRVIVSELIALTRLLLTGHSNTLPDDIMATVSEIVASIPELLQDSTAFSINERSVYYRTLGLVLVLGGSPERFLRGSEVRRGDHGLIGPIGVIERCSVDRGTAAVIWADSPSEHEHEGNNTVPVAQLESATGSENPTALHHVAGSPSFYLTFAAILKSAHVLMKKTHVEISASSRDIAAVELVLAWLRMYSTSMLMFPSLLTYRAPNGSGNIALLLYQLAKTSKTCRSVDSLEDSLSRLCEVERRLEIGGEHSVPGRSHVATTSERECVLDAASSSSTNSADFVFSPYAYTCNVNDNRRHGRNKLLEYWEKHVIPAIKSYVAGSFKSYEMDYFFAQLREPLRDGNSAAAMKIANTLCDGHVPSGCHFPDPETDWSALQIDDIVVGERYVVTYCSDSSDFQLWPAQMKWTVGHVGTVRLVHPHSLVLLEIRNPRTARFEFWWYRVEHLISVSNEDPLASVSKDVLCSLVPTIMATKIRLTGAIARSCIFSILEQTPEAFPLINDRPSIMSHFTLVDLLRVAAYAELGCERSLILGELPHPTSTSRRSTSYPLLESLRKVLTYRFEASAHEVDCVKVGTVVDIPVSNKIPSNKGREVSAFKVKDAKSIDRSDREITDNMYRYKLIDGLVQELKRALESNSSFLQQNACVVQSESPPKPLVQIRIRNASCLVISFAVHPALMDLPTGSSLEFFTDEGCTNLVSGYYGDKQGLNYLSPLIIPHDRCFVRASQNAYSRYKFRVDPLTPDFGLALWILDEICYRVNSVTFTGQELEAVVSSVLASLASFLSSTAVSAPNVKGIVCERLTRMINFCITKSLVSAVPLPQLSSLTKDLSDLYQHEVSSQKALFSTPLQQYAELISAVEEVSRLKGGSSYVLADPWWPSFARLATFTRVLAHKPEPSVAYCDIMSRISCGRSPAKEIEVAWQMMQTSDLMANRIILIQKLPRTSRSSDLKDALSLFVSRIAHEECGGADDQTVASATSVVRLGILASVLHLPVCEDGMTAGFAFIDVGRSDVIPRVLVRLSKENFIFDGEATAEDVVLVGQIALLAETDQSSDTSVELHADTGDTIWSCGVCTLENPVTENECAACGSPIPADIAQTVIDQQAGQSSHSPADRVRSSESEGWKCGACTLLNPWVTVECGACGGERDPSLVAPTQEFLASENPDTECAPVGATTHTLSGVSAADAIRIAEQHEVKQVASFLRSLFIDEGCGLTETLSRLIHRELNNTDEHLPNITQQIAAAFGSESINQAVNVNSSKKLSVNEEILAKTLEIARTEPIKLLKLLRGYGYDVTLEQSSYATAQAARASQAKWTHQMDIQLVSLGRRKCSELGLVSLLDFCPSHICAADTVDIAPLSSLETRDLRLRFMLLKALNRCAVDALPLVNMRNASDPQSLRARLVAVRQLIFPAVKVKFYADTQDKANVAEANLVDVSMKRPVVTLDRRAVIAQRATGKPWSLDDPKLSLFASTMIQLAKVKPSALRAKRPTGASDPFVSFVVVFESENVVGEGGPYRQLFNDIVAELLSPSSPLFVPTQNNVTKIGEYRDRYLPKPGAKSKRMLKMFEFIGVLMGCCIRTGVRLNLRLAPIVWKLLVNQRLSTVDLEHIDWSLCESLKYLKMEASNSLDSVMGDVFLDSFTTVLSDGTVVELIPNGHNTPVTKTNCKEYVRLAKAARLQECQEQVESMLCGVGHIVPRQLLQLLSWSELQQWVCGSLSIDLDLLKRHTLYSSGMTPDTFPHLDMFWKVLSEFSEENKRRFIKFAWGQDTLPADDAEFDRTHTRLLIKAPPSCATDQDALLPKADTCFFNVELPAYSTVEVMREKLLLAITYCTSMDGDDQAGAMDVYFAGDEEM